MSRQEFSGKDLTPGIWYKFKYEGKDVVARYDSKTDNEYKFSEQEPTDHEILWDLAIASNEAEDRTHGIKFYYAGPGDVDSMWLTQGGKRRTKKQRKSKKSKKSRKHRKSKKHRR